MVPNGLMSFRAYYGATGLHPAEPPGRLHSSWSTGVEACLPHEIHLGSPRVQAFDESMQEQLRRDDVDFVDERRRQASIRNAWYNQALRRYHERFVHSRELRVGDLVLKRILNHEGLHNLSPSWEVPFKVLEICRHGCVHLATEEGVPLPNPWNIEHLRKFYP